MINGGDHRQWQETEGFSFERTERTELSFHFRECLIMHVVFICTTYICNCVVGTQAGQCIDMAVGVIIGGAFGKIVSSVVADVIMPPLGLLIGGVNFTDLKWVMKPAEVVDGKEIAAVTLNYGNFLQATFDFLIIAFSIFMFIKLITKLTEKKKAEEPAAPPAPPAPTKEEVLLTEIRDILKEK